MLKSSQILILLIPRVFSYRRGSPDLSLASLGLLGDMSVPGDPLVVALTQKETHQLL